MVSINLACSMRFTLGTFYCRESKMECSYFVCVHGAECERWCMYCGSDQPTVSGRWLFLGEELEEL